MHIKYLKYIIPFTLIILSTINIIYFVIFLLYLGVFIFGKRRVIETGTIFNKKEIFSLDNNLKEKYKDFLEDKSINDIQEIIILENKNILTIENFFKISYYEKIDLKYKKVFNNMNKNEYIFGLCGLKNNRCCFISYLDHEYMHFHLFNNETFEQKEIDIKMKKAISNIKSKNIFPISHNNVIIISKFEFYIFNVNLLEIHTIYKLGLICSVLPFNIKKNNDTDYSYEYFCVIFYENKNRNFFLKIYHVNSDSDYYIEESDKINIFKSYKFDNIIIDYFKEESKKTEEYINEYYIMIYNYHDRQKNINFLKDIKRDEVFIYLNYDLKNDNDITFKVNFLVPFTLDIYKTRFISLNPIQLNKIKFK